VLLVDSLNLFGFAEQGFKGRKILKACRVGFHSETILILRWMV